MLGEGLTAGAPVQHVRFDEAAFDRPTRRRLRSLPLAVGAMTALAVLVSLLR